MWTLKEGLEAIRAIQYEAHELHYSLALGGSVLNQGKSDKDLDIIAVPFHGKEASPKKENLIKLFENKFNAIGEDWHHKKEDEYGSGTSLKFDDLFVFFVGSKSELDDGTIKIKEVVLNRKRIDLFIIL